MLQEKFSYSSQPHAAPMKTKNKPKYRENDIDATPLNMMFDPRVVRGNTYSAKTTSPREAEGAFRDTTNKDSTKRRQEGGNSRRGVTTPPAVDGRVHMNIQTETFLEELSDKPIEIDMETQTQAIMDRPMSPLFVFVSTGLDAMTQILPGDLFDFDLEVEPLLEVLVGKTIHVSMLELMQEEELEAIRRDQEEFEIIRNIELAEVQRLEAEARRKQQEKERRLQQEQKRVKERSELEDKVAARAFSKQYLSSLHQGVMSELFDEGFFFDPVKKEIEDIFMIDVTVNITRRADAYDAAKKLMEELLLDAGIKCKKVQQDGAKLRLEQKEARRLEEIREKELAEQAALEKAASAAAAAKALEVVE